MANNFLSTEVTLSNNSLTDIITTINIKINNDLYLSKNFKKGINFMLFS